MFRILALMIIGVITSSSALASELELVHGWARETPPGKSMTAAYGKLRNIGRESLVVTGVSTEVAARSSIHMTRIERDRSTMRPVSNVTIAPGEEVELAPGALHIMLMKLEAPLVSGESIDICFELENNADVCLPIRVAKQMSPGHRH